MNVVSIRAGIIPVEDVGGRIAVAVLMAQHSLATIKGNVWCLVRGKIYSLWGTILFVIIEEESPIRGKEKDDLFFIHRPPSRPKSRSVRCTAVTVIVVNACSLQPREPRMSQKA